MKNVKEEWKEGGEGETKKGQEEEEEEVVVAENVVMDEEELKKRRDLREKMVFTIDPATAKDLDDALSIEDLGDGTYEVCCGRGCGCCNCCGYYWKWTVFSVSFSKPLFLRLVSTLPMSPTMSPKTPPSTLKLKKEPQLCT